MMPPALRTVANRRRRTARTTATTAAMGLIACLAVSCAQPGPPPEESGYDLWLRYDAAGRSERRAEYRRSLKGIVVEGESPTLDAARDELTRGLTGLLGRDAPRFDRISENGLLIVGTPATSPIIAGLRLEGELDRLGDEGFLIRLMEIDGRSTTVIASRGEVGVLYGVFHLLQRLQTEGRIDGLDIAERPRIQLRLLNHWDNLDGTIERGYAGSSIWPWNSLPPEGDSRIIDYARANASIGINGVVLNNVNADPRILRGDYLTQVAGLADVLRPYGIRVYLSANFGAPLPPSATPDESKRWGGIGDLDTADPLDPAVRQWWHAKTDEIYALIPDFGGFLVKANSEGMPGPNDYGRSHSDGANMLADALAPHGGIVIWRAFVYPSNADPDRTKRAYSEFVPLDGVFASNVFVQPKTGPLDFQPREPFHPLFGAMPATPLMAELQITQEYLGHSTHLVYLAPMWEEVLDSETFADSAGLTVAQVIDDASGSHGTSGIAGVANVGSDSTWTGHHFAQANWFAYGRLAWNPALDAAAIAEEWARMTWGNEPELVRTVTAMMAGSWNAAVDYMTPLGLSITVEGGEHYQPQPEQRQGNYWYADSAGIGYDRSRVGSAAVDQYHEPLSDLLNDPQTTPVAQILWFHWLPWDYTLSTQRNVWDELAHRYESGVQYVDSMQAMWQGLQGEVDARRWREVEIKLEEQQQHARHWRDHSLLYFQCRSGRALPDSIAQEIASSGAGSSVPLAAGVDTSDQDCGR